jgi:large subunit ribosomal protein L15
MKLHDLRPNPGAHTPKTRVGRGIAGGKGKTAGRGTKGQKARAGGSIPPWFEGGQTPLHIRIPKLRGFKNRGKILYEVVNLGAINRLVALGELGVGETSGSAASARRAPVTVNQEILRAAGLVSTLARPLKVLGHGEISAPLFVVADAFSKSALEKIEAAGGTAQQLETPTSRMAALMGTGTDVAEEPRAATRAARKASAPAARAPKASTAPSPRAAATPAAPVAEPEDEAPAARPSRRRATESSAAEAPAAESEATAPESQATAPVATAPDASADVDPEAAAGASVDPEVTTEPTTAAEPADAPGPVRRSRAKGASSEADGGAA